MQERNGRGFLSGMLLGVVVSLLTGLIGVYLLIVLDIVSVSVVDTPGVQALGEWTRRNLGLSVLPFAITLGLYLHSLRALARRLDDSSPQNEIGQLEHLTDVWTSLFFGIGVIWTAIGMRSALLYALGDPAMAAESESFAILTRLVDGGILTALTTTIVGWYRRLYDARDQELVSGHETEPLLRRTGAAPCRAGRTPSARYQGVHWQSFRNTVSRGI